MFLFDLSKTGSACKSPYKITNIFWICSLNTKIFWLLWPITKFHNSYHTNLGNFICGKLKIGLFLDLCEIFYNDDQLIKLEDLVYNFIQGAITEFENIEIGIKSKEYKTEIDTNNEDVDTKENIVQDFENLDKPIKTELQETDETIPFSPGKFEKKSI